ncbi:MAG TPA: M20/M25/M40 family metallo-hydrolase [Ktedonobacterales bacterium]|nr:M20/M25/M40 family metallo-hydrolase [Ktedonobacterales bacterium]
MPDQTTIEEIDQHIVQHLDKTLHDLSLLCHQPSVAAQNYGIVECAELVGDLLRQRGFTVQILPSGGSPVVVADAPGRSSKTMLLYNHYDVQPAEPLELWTTPPFEPDIREGKFFARGAGDDKGHILCRLAALDAFKDVTGEYPCHIRFIIEGEEEIGSVHLPDFIEQNKDILGGDACLWEFGSVDYEDRPEVYLGMRGICYVELRVKTAKQDAHSGLAGSIFPNAAWRLVWALNTLKDQEEHILIPGFYDAVLPPSERDLAMLAALPNEEADLKQTYGIDGFLKGLTGAELRREAVFVPTCTICGITTGYQGPGSKTVLPAEASAKVDFRLVPNQTPADIIDKLRKHLDAQGFSDIDIHQHGGTNPARVNPDDPFVAICTETAAEVYGKATTVAPMIGGSGPMYPFVHVLNVPIGAAGIGYPGGRAHAPDENFRLDDFVKGAQHTARILARFSE